MEYTRLGNTGLNVSRICFGCMFAGVAPGLTMAALGMSYQPDTK